MKMKMRILRAVMACVAVFLGSALAAQALPCDSAGGCAECFNDQSNIASCITVSYDAFCNCSISANNQAMCILSDPCDYSGGAGGGGGGGTGGGGSGGCNRSPGGWCPAECSSCGTVFWY